MTNRLSEVLDHAQAWPPEDQAELADIAEWIESRRRGVYRPTADELEAIDEADRSGIATSDEVEVALRSFRRV